VLRARAPDTESRTVDTHVKRLRQELGVASHFIETVRGVGDRLGDGPEDGAGRPRGTMAATPAATARRSPPTARGNARARFTVAPARRTGASKAPLPRL
jgi:hypothetical protein